MKHTRSPLHARVFSMTFDDILLTVLIAFVFGMFFGLYADLEALK